MVKQVKKNRSDFNQTGLFGEKAFVPRNKKIIKSGTLRFHPPSGESFEEIINDMEEKFHRTKFIALTSGGKDSMTTAIKLADMGKLDSLMHIKTNVGLEMTTDFIRDYAQELGFKLYIQEPQPKFTYASHVLQYGFPSASFHRVIMGKLKYKTMRDFALTIDRKNHCLVSGVRKFESVRRMGNYPYPIQSDGAMWFTCPIFYMDNEEVYRFVLERGIKISPAYKLGLGTSGECMCGSFAVKGEKALLRELDPKLADYIEWLEEGIQRFGTPHAKKYPKWGDQAKMSELEEQQQMTQFFNDNPDLKPVNDMEGLICGTECGPGSMKGMLDY
jgi:3'-phosphoadenosine 5'-phosphosulfate sulfotransferase (PAPS reductase)/FAD synthetase